MDVGFTEIYFLDVQKWTSFLFALFRAKDCAVGYPILDYLLSKEYAVGCLSLVQASALLVCTLPIPQWRWTIAEMSASVWTSSTSVQTFGAIIHPNSEFWQRIGQPYAHKSGRCFVAVVDIEADRCAVCFAELDAVQSEADRQADVH